MALIYQIRFSVPVEWPFPISGLVIRILLTSKLFARSVLGNYAIFFHEKIPEELEGKPF
jgi:hypothetical protein